MWSQLTAYSTAGYPFAYNDDDRCGGLVWHWDREFLRTLYFSSIAFENPDTQDSMMAYVDKQDEKSSKKASPLGGPSAATGVEEETREEAVDEDVVMGVDEKVPDQDKQEGEVGGHVAANTMEVDLSPSSDGSEKEGVYITDLPPLEVPGLPAPEIHDVEEGELVQPLDAVTMSKRMIVEEEEPEERRVRRITPDVIMTADEVIQVTHQQLGGEENLSNTTAVIVDQNTAILNDVLRAAEVGRDSTSESTEGWWRKHWDEGWTCWRQKWTNWDGEWWSSWEKKSVRWNRANRGNDGVLQVMKSGEKVSKDKRKSSNI